MINCSFSVDIKDANCFALQIYKKKPHHYDRAFLPKHLENLHEERTLL